uniref:Bromo domain-containing protein n=1 Tax=Trichobilharzia regenti TaxID=157069 RepID=A0AA85J6Q2_TRIRE|nr:unnamed protein product [Trichobilharzia regenti]
MDLIEKNLEVKLSWEILETLMSRQYAHVNYLFMDNTESMKWNNDFRNTGMVPMCFTKMNEKFINGTYRGIREFVCDFRLMLLNCYRTHGISSRAGRCAEKLELLLEQKLQLLSPEIRNKASIQSTLGFGTAEDELLDCGITRRRSSGRLFLSGDSRQLTPIRAIMEELEHVTHPGSGTGGITASLISNSIDSSTSASSSGQQTSAISSTLSTEENIAILVARLSLWQRRRHEEELLDTWNSWWVENNGPKMQEILFNAPELLEAYQFLWLADPFLGISDCITIYNNNNNNHNNLAVNALSTTASHTRSLSLFDLEIGLCTAPCASLVLNVCMSNLLATPKERNQIVNVLSNTTTTTNNNNSSNSNLSVGADSSTTTDYFSAAARRSRQLMSTTSTLPPLDYDIWERRLSARVDSWYRSFWDKGKGVVEWATYRLGLPKAFFDVCGYKSNPLEEKRFHELSIYQQVMLLCALCESTVRSFENLRVSLDRSADWEASNPVQLGIDFFSKHVYVHFPQLLGINPTTCLRVYRIPYVKHQPIECSFFKTAKNTNACNLKDMYKAKILNDFTKFAEILEETVSVKSENDDNSNNNNNSKKSNKRRRPSTKLKPEDTIDPVNHQQKLIEELNKHNNYLLENGLSVPGAVQRFPSWMHPALARDTYRRWHCVAEQCSAAASAAATANQIDELNKMNTTTTTNNNHHNNNKRTADRRSSVGVSRGATYPDNTPNSKSRNSINNNVTTNKDDLPFKDYQIIDEQIISEMMKRDHCLNPSPYASFNGPTRKFLSLQLSRTAIGGFRFCEKTHARRHNKKGVVNKNEEDDGGGGDDNNEEEDNDGDDDDDTESRSIDQNTNDPRSPSVSQYESDENESISGNSVQTRRRSTRLSNVAKQNGPVATNRTPSTRSSSLLDNKKEGATCKGKTEQSTTDKLNSTPSSSSSSSSSSNKQKISDDNNNNNNNNNNENNEGKVKKEKEEEGDEEEHEEEEEEEILVTEPPRESFTLVAKDTQEVNQLLLILRQLLASNEEKLMKSQIDCNLDSDCDDPSDGNNNNNNNNVDGIGVDVNGTGDADKKGDGDNDDDDSINEPAAKKKRLSPDCDDDGVNTQVLFIDLGVRHRIGPHLPRLRQQLLFPSVRIEILAVINTSSPCSIWCCRLQLDP